MPACPSRRDPWARHAIPAMRHEPPTKVAAMVAKILPSVSPKSPSRTVAMARRAAIPARAAAPFRYRLRNATGSGGRAGLPALALVLLDEFLDLLDRVVVDDLLRRGFHQVRAWPFERAGDAVVQRQLGEPDRVDDDAG